MLSHKYINAGPDDSILTWFEQKTPKTNNNNKDNNDNNNSENNSPDSNEKESQRQRLDYIFYRGGDIQGAENVYAEGNVESLSDHLALFATFIIQVERKQIDGSSNKEKEKEKSNNRKDKQSEEIEWLVEEMVECIYVYYIYKR